MRVEITPDVANRLGHYVYVYIDPRDSTPFYVGKGVATRATSHLDGAGETRKLRKIAEIRAAGLEPRIDIIAHGLRDQQEAFRVEAAMIELLGTASLTNEVRGWGSSTCCRKPLHDFIVETAPRRIDVTHPTLLIRINRLFRYGMDAKELYEATRGVWKIGNRRRQAARYAMAIFAGVVREVYEIKSWHPAGTTSYESRDTDTLHQNRRWEFIGSVADDTIREQYVGGGVDHYFVRGQQSPIVGVLLTGRDGAAPKG
jgi:hypothetical protein